MKQIRFDYFANQKVTKDDFINSFWNAHEVLDTKGEFSFESVASVQNFIQYMYGLGVNKAVKPRNELDMLGMFVSTAHVRPELQYINKIAKYCYASDGHGIIRCGCEDGGENELSCVNHKTNEVVKQSDGSLLHPYMTAVEFYTRQERVEWADFDMFKVSFELNEENVIYANVGGCRINSEYWQKIQSVRKFYKREFIRLSVNQDKSVVKFEIEDLVLGYVMGIRL
jgi:hypothetical protein